jgi:hypothetical protein
MRTWWRGQMHGNWERRIIHHVNFNETRTKNKTEIYLLRTSYKHSLRLLLGKQSANFLLYWGLCSTARLQTALFPTLIIVISNLRSRTDDPRKYNRQRTVLSIVCSMTIHKLLQVTTLQSAAVRYCVQVLCGTGKCRAVIAYDFSNQDFVRRGSILIHLKVIYIYITLRWIKQDRQQINKCNTEARSRNHCCYGKAVSITYSECVSVALVIQHAKRMRRMWLHHVFPHCLIIGTILISLESSRRSFEKCSNTKFHENPSSGSRVFPGGRADGRTDMTRLIVAFRHFAKTRKKIQKSLRVRPNIMTIRNQQTTHVSF